MRAAADFTQKSFHDKQAYLKRIVKDYDCYLLQGLDRKEAIKQISSDLRSENHPWSFPDLVRSSLIEAGRPGRIGRPRKNS